MICLTVSQQIGIEIVFFRIIRMIFYYIKAANNAMFGEKTVPGT